MDNLIAEMEAEAMPEKGMSEDDLSNLCSREIANATGYRNGTVSEGRKKSLEYYRGDPFGNEREGRSSVVSTDVADVIESILPSFMRVFMSGDNVVEFEPVGEEDEESAKQATDYVDFIFTKDNPGFQILYTALKDALIQKTGLIKHWWHETKAYTKGEATGISQEELAMLLQDASLELTEASENPSQDIDPMTGQPLVTYDVKYRKEEIKKRVKVMAVPPEAFLISSRARDIDSAAFCAHIEEITASDLIAEGYDPELVDSLPEDDSWEYNTPERIARFQDDGTIRDTIESNDRSMRKLLRIECYIRADYDGDGVAELRKVTVIGENADVILDNEEIDSVPISDLCPCPEPHKFIGRSMADFVMDIQLIKSTVQRQMLDNFYATNNARTVIGLGAGDHALGDLLTARPGGIIRADDVNAIKALETASLGDAPYTLMEYMDSVRETRTGVTRYNQGLDANSLNKTATGINAIMGAAQQRSELMTRIFGESLKRVFKEILKLTIKHQDQPRVVRLRNKWVTVDPRYWNAEMDMTVNVGLGTGNKDQLLQHYMTVHQLQMEAMQVQGGLDGALITAEKLLAGYARIVENAGLKAPEKYFNSPEESQQYMMEAAQAAQQQAEQQQMMQPPMGMPPQGQPMPPEQPQQPMGAM